MTKVAMLIACALTLVGCTDAQFGQLRSLGESAQLDCYSGGHLIYSGRSTGKVISSSDGWMFVDEATGKPIELTGDCVIRMQSPAAKFKKD